jgi:vitamin K-dependent gamma-carboxylase-like protein
MEIGAQSFRERLFGPTDIASLVFFRISLGFIYLAEVIRYFAYGWIDHDFIYPTVHFTYFGFSWISPWPAWGMYAHFIVMGLAAVGLMLGCLYRISAILCFLSFTYVFLLDQTLYLNHFYLMCVLAFLMIFLPAHRAASIDAWRKPTLRSDFIPAWPRLLLLSFISLVYFYAGIAKLNTDWFTGNALRLWLPRAARVPLLGPLTEHELAAYFFAYGGLAFDLLVVPLLLWRRTRMFGFIWALAFHFLNFLIFNIGVFPWLMIVATTLYFSPDWPRRWLKLWKRKTETAIFEYSSVPIRLGAAFLILQALIPLRHLLYPGPVNWTEEGHRFSWRMMLRTKEGTATFVVTDPVTKDTWKVDPQEYLTPEQARKTALRPDMLLQFAHFLAEAEAAPHNRTNPLEVRVISSLSLDGRPPQPLVYPHIDLAKVRRHLGHNDWIVPLMSEEEAAKLQPPKPQGEPSTVLLTVAATNTAVLSAPRTDDSDAAFSRILQSAEAGIVEAQYQAALRFFNGHGTDTNYVQAMKWSTLAARQGHEKATALKNELRDRISPFQAALAKRLISDYVTRTNQ